MGLPLSHDFSWKQSRVSVNGMNYFTTDRMFPNEPLHTLGRIPRPAFVALGIFVSRMLFVLQMLFGSAYLAGELLAQESRVGRAASGASFLPLVNADFETPGADNPPPGWAMWGPSKDKIPEHFVRDTTVAHSGKASLRIFHPKGSRGYIVTDPQHAIRPRKGHMYRITFWAKADRPRAAQFRITAYQSIRPFVDAPSPGGFVIQVAPEWREYSFQIVEGLDFFADQSQYLLLTFIATADIEEEGTLWVDDITVEERPSSYPALINLSTIEYQRLKEPLGPGDYLAVNVDGSRSVGATVLQVSGISFHRVAGWTGQPYSREGTYRLLPPQEEAIRELRLPMTRFYAVADEPFPVETAVDRIASLCRRLGIPEDWTVLELEDQSAARKVPPNEWAKAVAYARKRNYRFRHWEVANEPYSGMWGKGGAFASAEEYVAHVRQVSQAIRAVDTSAQVGIAIHPRNVRWGNLVLKEAAGHYDFVVGHYYSFPRIFNMAFEDVAITENMRILDHILRINALIRLYNPDREVYQLDTEWGLHASGPEGQRADYVDRNANIWGVIHRAVRMIYYARGGLLRGASGWQMLSRSSGQGFAILFSDLPEATSMLYWLYYYVNRHMGPELLAMDGQAPFHKPLQAEDAMFAGPLTPVLATRNPNDNTIFLIIVNASWTQQFPMRVTLRGCQPKGVTTVLLSDDVLDGKPLLVDKAQFVRSLPVMLDGQTIRAELPPHCVLFVKVETGPSLWR